MVGEVRAGLRVGESKSRRAFGRERGEKCSTDHRSSSNIVLLRF